MCKTPRWSGLVLAAALLAPGCSRPLPRFGGLEPSSRQLAIDSDLRLFSLSNGMMVLLAPDKRTNLVSVDVRYRVGASQDPDHLAGLAHLVEHLTFQARSGSSGATIYDRLSSLTLTFNAYTNHDVTHYTSTALAERLDALLELEAQRLEARCDQLADALVARERDVVLAEEAERRTATTDVSLAIASEVWGKHHPYARPIGSREVAAATKGDACAFFDGTYLPQRAVLVVTGNFDATAIQPRIGRRFGPITRAGTSHAPAIAPARLDGSTSLHRADVDHPVVQIYLPAPAWGSADEAVHDMVIADLAGELNRLERDRDWVLDTAVGYAGDGERRATVVSVAVKDPDHLQPAIDEVFRRGRDLFQDDDHDGHAGDNDDRDDRDVLRLIGAMRGRLQTETVTRLDAIAGRGDWLADYMTYTDEHAFAVGRLRAVDAITAQALVDHATSLFDPEGAHVAQILPSGHAKAAASAITSVGGRTYDLVPWRFEVDPTEATRPLAMPRNAARLEVEDYRFTNGLRVLLFLDPTSPIIDARMVYPVGTIDDLPGQPGVASFAARMLDHDLDRDYPGATVDRLNWAFGIGTQIDVDVDDNATVFSAGGMAVFGDWHVWRLSWLLDQGVYPPKDLTAVRTRLRTLGDDEQSPSALAFRTRLFGAGHPYAAPAATVEQLAAITRGQLGSWRDHHYVPSGATLIVTGGFDKTAMHRALGELFGHWGKRSPPARAAVPAPRPAPGPSWMGVRIPTATQVKLYVSFAARSQPGADRAARVVLTEMVIDRLRIVREGLGASYGVNAGYAGGTAGTALGITTALDPARAPEAAVAVTKELAALQRDAGAQAEAFARARRRVLARLLATSRDATTVADELEWSVRNQVGVDQLQALPAAVANLTLADITAVAASDLDPTRMVVSVDGQGEPVAATLTALGATDPTWFDE